MGLLHLSLMLVRIFPGCFGCSDALWVQLFSLKGFCCQEGGRTLANEKMAEDS